jgi:hypothetical protein
LKFGNLLLLFFDFGLSFDQFFLFLLLYFGLAVSLFSFTDLHHSFQQFFFLLLNLLLLFLL